MTGHRNVLCVNNNAILSIEMQKTMSDILTNKEIVPNKELEISTNRSQLAQQNPPSSSNSNMPIANCNVELSANPSFRQ